ncbi:MAG: hypothetical protein JNN30_21320 [Rhodanobacteraceae bacterium]|nr:hypothetical protein [Rhodanobacteraceae bacterium]
MSLRARPAAAALLALLTASAVTAEPFALAPAYDQIYRVDLATRTATLVGATGQFAGQPIVLKGMAYAPSGSLLASSDNTKSLFRLDFLNSKPSFVGSLGLAGQGDPARFDALDLSYAVTCDGSAWLASGVTRKLWKVDTNTGATSYVGTTGARITGLAARGRDLYGTGDYENPSLFRINTSTGSATAIGSFNVSSSKISSVWPAFDSSGQLWAAVSYIPPPPPAANAFPPDWSDLARLDPASGAMTLLGPITGPEDLRSVPLFGFAIAPQAPCPTGVVATPQPVPAGSPTGYALLAGLVALLASFGLRRRSR